MTEEKINEVNEVLDSIYTKMLEAGFDRDYLNKAFVAFNLLTLLDEQRAFMYILRQLRDINEQVEKYEICAYINEHEKQLKD